MRTSAAIGQLSNDGYFDLIVGNYAGGLNYFQQFKNPPVAGVHQLIDDNSPIHVYPNPAKEIITFRFQSLPKNELINLSIFNNKSFLVLNTEIIFTGEKQIDISAFNPGIYYYLISGSETHQSYTGSFIKIK